MGVRVAGRRVRHVPADARRWVRIARGEMAAGEVRVFYGQDAMPSRQEVAHGGAVKFQGLQDEFPNSPQDFNVLYLGSTTIPRDARTLVALARRRGAAFVWNQNGVAYRGWYGDGYERVNTRLANALHEADHVFFQSEFCKLGSDRFLGERRGPSEVLYNPVDTRHFTPATERARSLTVLVGGNQYQRYRFETAVRAFALVAADRPNARLLVTGLLSWTQLTDPPAASEEAQKLLCELGIEDRVDLVGSYTQQEAPRLMGAAHLLLHTKYNDPCPNVVLEALACGLPVVHSASGGVPELVGRDAGIGIPAPLDWEQDHPPDPELLAEAIHQVVERFDDYVPAARDRAVMFDVRRWVKRHREVFSELTG